MDQGEPPTDRLPAAAARQIRSGTAAAFQPQSYAELKAAVNLYCSDQKDQAVAQHGEIAGWDVSKITALRASYYGLFQGKADFIGDLNRWNVSQVTSMQYMFYQAAAFNGDLNGWDTKQVTDMYEMFEEAAAFNGDLDGWDTKQVTSMYGMFSEAAAYNGDLNGWDTKQVTEMQYMFYQAAAFNSDLSAWTSPESDVDTRSMFNDASAFSPANLATWTTWAVPTARFAPADCTELQAAVHEWFDEWYPAPSGTPLQTYGPISRWDVSRCTNSDGLFKALDTPGRMCDGVVCGVGEWSTAAMTSMASTFAFSPVAGSNLGAWD